MLPLIQKEVVERKQWISRTDFIDMIAISQSLPGVFAVNIAIFAGYRMKGNPGSIGARSAASGLVKRSGSRRSFIARRSASFC